MSAEPLLTPGIATPVVVPEISLTWVAVVHDVAREIGVRADTRLEPPGPGRNHWFD
ncbi:hypothetical protein [Planotetraspora sp. GP83]|uniref:hypothetical protein n=1 Tax=Planotetraspora sp. GP83 TaxID=3156264 RepID=UPI003512DB99